MLATSTQGRQSSHLMATAMNTCLFWADSGNNAARKLTPTGGAWKVSTVAGPADNYPGHADGRGPQATFYGPSSVAVDGTGNVYGSPISIQKEQISPDVFIV
jgi:hypothetical protein